MTKFEIPVREEVGAENKTIFDNLKSALGFVPNLYAVLAYSDTGLGRYLQFQNGKTSLSNKEKEVINLVVSQVNGCRYCQSAHTVIAKMNGFDNRLDALAKLTFAISSTRGNPDKTLIDRFMAAGYTSGSLVDLVLAIADKIVMNYLHKITEVAIDFPEAPVMVTENA